MVKIGLVVKSLPGLLKGIASSYNEDFYCLNCFCAYTTKNNEDNKITVYYLCWFRMYT